MIQQKGCLEVRKRVRRSLCSWLNPKWSRKRCKDKVETKKSRLEEHCVDERHHLEAQILSANAVSASNTITAKQHEQFGSFLDLYTQKNNLSLSQTSTDITSFSSTSPICIARHTSSPHHQMILLHRRINRGIGPSTEAHRSQRTQMTNQACGMHESHAKRFLHTSGAAAKCSERTCPALRSPTAPSATYFAMAAPRDTRVQGEYLYKLSV